MGDTPLLIDTVMIEAEQIRAPVAHARSRSKHGQIVSTFTSETLVTRGQRSHPGQASVYTFVFLQAFEGVCHLENTLVTTDGRNSRGY